jgi:hypothetical protein
MPLDRRVSQRLLADLEALLAESLRNQRETGRITRAIDALKAAIAKSQSQSASQTSAAPISEFQKPNEAA